ncbi:MAG: MBOAT family O-acyltransferase, partial [Bacteroidales bacterium]|nr:MBOAT family O-acyltransferase [Bacteroidales bacterium]
LWIRNAFVILSSYIFYGWWDWRFLSLIVFSSAIDFIIGLLLARTQDKFKRKALLFGTLGVNLGILGFFKYFNFFAGSLQELASLFGIHLNTTTLNIILPVGISFYTFQTMSYTIDVYFGKLKPTRDILAFFAFVSFFPQLVAGPIERASNLLGQFFERKTFNYERSVSGLRLMLWGFFKKIVIADNFGLLTDRIFDPGNELNGLTVMAGAVFFALQIYADFSGYSDIAIGIARMLGFVLMTNFRTPYFALSFGDFWKRWHISLSTWFRDYVYIPLGGNKKGDSRMYINLMITFLLSGLWHGASYNFLIWGGLYGILLIAEKMLKPERIRYIYPVFVIVCVVLLWIPFRAVDFSHLWEYTHSLFHFAGWEWSQLSGIIYGFTLNRFIATGIIFIFFMFIEMKLRNSDFDTWISAKPKFFRMILYYSILIIIMLAGNFTVKPDFIYFQF